jgi:hypothetical protein
MSGNRPEEALPVIPVAWAGILTKQGLQSLVSGDKLKSDNCLRLSPSAASGGSRISRWEREIFSNAWTLRICRIL